MVAFWCGLGIGVPTKLAAQSPLPRITPGTIVDISGGGITDRERWNQVLLLATPRIASGDTEKLSESIRESVSGLTLTILATISKDDNDRYRLVEVGVGYSVPVDGKQLVVSIASASQLRVKLSFVASQMLRENENRLTGVVRVASTSSWLMFDAPAVLHRGGEHRDYTVRHLCWINPNTGNAATLVWLLGMDSKSASRIVNEPPRVVAVGTVEDRRIHVDGSEFLFGIPNDRAFALESLPPGPAMAWPNPVSPLVSKRDYTTQELTELVAYLNQIIAGARSAPTTER